MEARLRGLEGLEGRAVVNGRRGTLAGGWLPKAALASQCTSCAMGPWYMSAMVCMLLLFLVATASRGVCECERLESSVKSPWERCMGM